ncbi:hypothetical protein [Delftia sp. ZNC0008]|uniref:hypothetical protein n=1 Tax=Delftia sp. ZNC0008 TaxID=1339242 RepID=UPI000648BDDA|nr:hypothetical protein [Delftia sp. ZNC0008]
MTNATPTPEEIFGPADSDWNVKREQLEKAAILAAAELIAHSGAAGIQGLEGFGVSLSIRLTDATN